MSEKTFKREDEENSVPTFHTCLFPPAALGRQTGAVSVPRSAALGTHSQEFQLIPAISSFVLHQRVGLFPGKPSQTEPTLQPSLSPAWHTGGNVTSPAAPGVCSGSFCTLSSSRLRQHLGVPQPGRGARGTRQSRGCGSHELLPTLPPNAHHVKAGGHQINPFEAKRVSEPVSSTVAGATGTCAPSQVSSAAARLAPCSSNDVNHAPRDRGASFISTERNGHNIENNPQLIFTELYKQR